MKDSLKEINKINTKLDPIIRILFNLNLLIQKDNTIIMISIMSLISMLICSTKKMKEMQLYQSIIKAMLIISKINERIKK